MFNSFDEVVKHYNKTKPIRGARLSENIRPISQRRYWWNRIIKINDNKYALSDGSYMWWARQGMSSVDLVIEHTSPVLWERREDGDYVTLRSHNKGNISVSRYTFLDRYTPRGMRFEWHQNGKHFVIDKQGVSHYLPKFNVTFDYHTNKFEMHEDNKVVFKAESDGTFTRANEAQPYQTKRIDKELDKSYAGKVSELWDWAKVVLPMLGETIVTNRNEYSNSLNGTHYWYWTKGMEVGKLVKEILDNPEHEKRINLAVLLANDIGAVNGNRFEAHANSLYLVKQAIRKAAGFYVVEPR
jgi:hypothetical protein